MHTGRTSTFVVALLILAAITYFSYRDEPSSVPAASYAAPTSDDDSGSDGLTFRGDDCTVDCSGHEAGYRWAEEHDITDEEMCGGNSESFIEGCQAYAREHDDADVSDGDPDDDE
jgi:hypothetical protein